MPGTLFQMPLRTPAQAETSQLSTRAYTHEEMLDMLIAFGGAANEMDLFLQSLQSIEVYLKVPLHPPSLRAFVGPKIVSPMHDDCVTLG